MSSRIVIERIATEEVLCASATPEDLSLVETYGSASRRAEALAWRGIVRRELGCNVTISYDEFGAPEVDLPNQYISVSHSRDFVAVMFADLPCAVDVEDSRRDFRRVASKYLTAEEQALAEQYNLFGAMWCAKEAMYKYHRRGGIDFLRDTIIKEYRLEDDTLVTLLMGEILEVRLHRDDNLLIAEIY